MKENYYDNQTVQDVIQIYNSLKTKFKPIFDRFNINYNMVVSRLQWKSELKEELNEEGRPANAYNLLKPVMKYLSSMENGTRKQLSALPIGDNDVEKARIATKLITVLHSNAKFDQSRSRAFVDACIAGWGWIQDLWQFDGGDPTGDLLIQPVSPFELMFETNYADTTLKKCKYLMHSPDLTLDEICTQYAHNKPDLLKAILSEAKPYFNQDKPERNKFLSTAIKTLIETASSFFSGESSNDTNVDLRNDTDWFNPLTGKFKILELHERRVERRFTIYDPNVNKHIDVTDQVIDEKNGYVEDEAKVNELMQKYSDSPAGEWRLIKQIWITTVVPALNLKVYEAPYPIQNGNFMFTPVFSYDFHADLSLTESPIEELIDSQNDYNKKRSIILEMLLRFSSLGYLVEDGAIDEFESDYTSKKIGQIKRVKPGFWEKIKPEESPTIPRELFIDQNETKSLIEHLSSNTAATKGMSDSSAETGKLFAMKKDASIQMVQHLYDNLDTSSVQVAENTWANAQKFLRHEKAFRINDDPDNPEFLTVNQPTVKVTPSGQVVEELLNDISVGKFDFKISNTPYGPTARELEFLKLVDLMKFAIEFDPEYAKEMFPVMIKASDTPYRAEFLEAIDKMKGKGQNDQVTQAMMMLQSAFQKLGLQKQQLDNQGTEIENQGKILDNKKKELELGAQQMADMVNSYLPKQQNASKAV